MKTLGCLALIGACFAILPVAAHAAETTTATVRINLGKLDLASPEGVEAAQRRIARAVADFCRNDVEHLTVEARRAARQCRDTVRSEALAALDARRSQQLAAR